MIVLYLYKIITTIHTIIIIGNRHCINITGTTRTAATAMLSQRMMTQRRSITTKSQNNNNKKITTALATPILYPAAHSTAACSRFICFTQ